MIEKEIQEFTGEDGQTVRIGDYVSYTDYYISIMRKYVKSEKELAEYLRPRKITGIFISTNRLAQKIERNFVWKDETGETEVFNEKKHRLSTHDEIEREKLFAVFNPVPNDLIKLNGRGPM